MQATITHTTQAGDILTDTFGAYPSEPLDYPLAGNAIDLLLITPAGGFPFNIYSPQAGEQYSPHISDNDALTYALSEPPSEIYIRLTPNTFLKIIP